MNRAVFLDRDGVISRVIVRDGHPHAACSLEELEFLPGVAEAIDALHGAGFRIIVVANQPDVARGLLRREVVEAMHERIRRTFAIDDIRVCYHVDRDGCACRKPKPGMLLEAARDWSVNLGESFMIGDRWRDIEAGRTAGCMTILVGGGYAERPAERLDAVTQSLLEASWLVLSGSGMGRRVGYA